MCTYVCAAVDYSVFMNFSLLSVFTESVLLYFSGTYEVFVAKDGEESKLVSGRHTVRG